MARMIQKTRRMRKEATRNIMLIVFLWGMAKPKSKRIESNRRKCKDMKGNNSRLRRWHVELGEFRSKWRWVL